MRPEVIDHLQYLFVIWWATAIVTVPTSIWVGVDSSRLGARRGALGGGLLDMGPISWMFVCLFFWIRAFPCYLVARQRLQAAQGAPKRLVQWDTEVSAQGGRPPEPLTAHAKTLDLGRLVRLRADGAITGGEYDVLKKHLLG
jgi:hypothetical protein